MNNVSLIGRLVRDPELRRAGETSVCTFTLAVDRPGKEKQADFIKITVFGKQAENCDKFLTKGKLCGVKGRIQTGSYTNKDGAKVYTTDVVAEMVYFLEWGEKQAVNENKEDAEPIPQGFSALNEDIPF